MRSLEIIKQKMQSAISGRFVVKLEDLYDTVFVSVAHQNNAEDGGAGEREVLEYFYADMSASGLSC